MNMTGSLPFRSVRWFRRNLLQNRGPAVPMDVEAAEQIFYIKYLREAMVVFDVGANVGELTLFFSRFVGQHGQVHAFEASSRTFARLKTVCESVNRKNITLYPIALAEKEGIVALHIYDDEHSGWNSLAERPLQNYGIDVRPVGTEQVPATTIDRFCQEHGISRIDLLKIDVEGAEYQVLQGARGMFANKKIQCCVFEFGQTTFDMGNQPDEIESYLKLLGYRLRNIVKGDPVFPGRTSVKSAQFSMHIAEPRT